MTTSFLQPLSSGQLDTLRGTDSLASIFRGRVRISTCPNTVVCTAKVDQITFPISFVQVTIDNVVGDTDDARIGQRVLIAASDDPREAYFSGRIRKAMLPIALRINETSAPVRNNHFVTVVDDYPILDKLGKETAGVLYMDYDVPYRPPRPLIYNLKSAYVGEIDPDSAVFAQSFAPLALAVRSGESISSWVWDVADGTITSGTETSQNITVEFPEGFRWIHLTVTDSNDGESIRHIPVWAHGDSYTPALVASDSIQVTGDVATGYDATLTSFDGVDDLLDNTLVVIWSDDEYQDGPGPVTGDNILFIGRVRKSAPSVSNQPETGPDSTVSLTLESPLTQLARLEQLPYEFLDKASPSAWGQVNNLTIWRAIAVLLSETSTFLELHSLAFDDTSDAFLLDTRNTSGNILDSMNDLALSINAALQMNAAGQCEIVRDAVMVEDTERNALATVAEWTESDLFEITSYEHDHADTIGRLKADGGSYNTGTRLFNAYRALAPGVAQGPGQGSETLDRQILIANQSETAAKLELRRRAGHALERAQPPDVLTLIFMDGYHGVLIPSRNIWHTFTLAATETFPGLTNDKRFLLVNVQVVHYGDGTKQVTAKFIRETQGEPGQDITQPPETGTPAPVPITPPFQYDPAFGGSPDFYLPPFATIMPIIKPDVSPRTDGNTIVTATATDLWLVNNFLMGAAPDFRSIHPEPGATIRAFLWYPWSPNNKGALALVGDGSTTAVYRTENAFGKPPVWVAGVALDGVYTRLRAEMTKGKIYIAGEDYAPANPGDIWSIYSAGTLDAHDDTTVTVTAEYFAGDEDHPGNFYYVDLITGSPNICAELVSHSESVGSVFAIGGIGCGIPYDPDEVVFPGGGCCNYYFIQDNNPFTTTLTFEACDETVAAFCFSRYSTDYGDTFDDPESIAASLLSGFDTGKKGTQILAGAGTQARLASAGGSYADYGDPKEQGALYIPRYTFGSTSSNNSGSTPQYLLASNVLNVDDEALWKVSGSGTTFTDITPDISGDKGSAAGSECLTMPWFNGNIIAAILKFGGLPRLVASTDGGSVWHTNGFLNSNANYIRMRKNDTTRKQAFFNNMGPAYCPNIQATLPLIYTRAYPGDTPIILIEPWGG